MVGQMSLAEIERPPHSYCAAADSFIAENPAWWSLVSRTALSFARAGRRFGMKALVEWSRFEMTRREIASPGITYRINNNWTSTFARRLVEQHPEVEPFIEFRKADNAPPVPGKEVQPWY